jgi:hypothetical protein
MEDQETALAEEAIAPPFSELISRWLDEGERLSEAMSASKVAAAWRAETPFRRVLSQMRAGVAHHRLAVLVCAGLLPLALFLAIQHHPTAPATSLAPIATRPAPSPPPGAVHEPPVAASKVSPVARKAVVAAPKGSPVARRVAVAAPQASPAVRRVAVAAPKTRPAVGRAVAAVPSTAAGPVAVAVSKTPPAGRPVAVAAPPQAPPVVRRVALASPKAPHVAPVAGPQAPPTARQTTVASPKAPGYRPGQ